MTYTSHGHHIPDSPRADEDTPPKRLARCGGPGLCSLCSSESGKWAENHLLQSAIEKVKMTGEKGHKSIIHAARYQAKNTNVVAVQYTGGSEGLDIQNWINANGGQATWNPAQDTEDMGDGFVHPAIPECLSILSVVGWHEVEKYWWVIQGPSGTFQSLPPGLFTHQYEPKE